ncbi:unnamed protein product [Medioppia subpectinata]|uniref:Peptidase S9 prolyl oligopeptidase catalytic domain-containing protein n=1 Tax=Medioppia subpectinata TaxID=1979941 RepID=A0A7R9KN57_9ACAR|nr:unnamed protein product [Medioppia subpectinata]CAG2106658.1 unnamed protein product [Medioppia subpectinata]
METTEVNDYMKVIEYLKSKYHYIDNSRIAVWGWAYGGYIAAKSLIQSNQQIFNCSLAVAPITNWLYWDSFTSERYFGDPRVSEDRHRYESANLILKADQFLYKRLFILHGTADDSVHLQHTFKLMKALNSAGVLYRSQIYPDSNHYLDDKLWTAMDQIHVSSLIGSSERKRFYKCVTIVENEDKYEINLDGRKLKTPNGHLFYTPNQSLALMVANEWQTQQRMIQLSTMHLTQLTNTAIDNPGHDCRQSLANSILEFIDSDTLCFRVNEPKELSHLQQTHWSPIVEWFEHRFECQIPITDTIALNPVSDEIKKNIFRHLCSHNRWSLIGLKFATENLKSLILSLALTQRRLSVDKCVDYSRLEEDFEIQEWGRIESTHDLELHALRARVSAALLFYFTNCENRQLSQKGDSYAKTLESVV